MYILKVPFLWYSPYYSLSEMKQTLLFYAYIEIREQGSQYTNEPQSVIRDRDALLEKQQHRPRKQTISHFIKLPLSADSKHFTGTKH